MRGGKVATIRGMGENTPFCQQSRKKGTGPTVGSRQYCIKMILIDIGHHCVTFFGGLSRVECTALNRGENVVYQFSAKPHIVESELTIPPNVDWLCRFDDVRLNAVIGTAATVQKVR